MTPLLVVNPVGDREFARFAEARVRGVVTIAELQAQLRTRYPRAVAHARRLTREGILIWYVYREGRWTAS